MPSVRSFAPIPSPAPSWDDELEFFSIKVPDGPLTEHLQKIEVGDTVLMKKKPTGTLVLDALLPGKRVYMLSTGTGIAPFASLIRDPETYEKFEEVILTHTTREIAELRYGEDLVAAIKDDPLVSEFATGRLRQWTSVTREPYERKPAHHDRDRKRLLFRRIWGWRRSIPHKTAS